MLSPEKRTIYFAHFRVDIYFRLLYYDEVLEKQLGVHIAEIGQSPEPS